jgi:hypothetical protein
MILYIGAVLVIGILSFIVARALVKERRHKNKQQAIAIAYDRLVRRFKLAVEYSEFLSNRYIGLDRRNRKLLVIDYRNSEKEEICIPLVQVGICKLIQVKDESGRIKTIYLELTNRRSEKSVRICFYHNEYDTDLELSSLLKKAIHWKSKIDIYRQRDNAGVDARYVL